MFKYLLLFSSLLTSPAWGQTEVLPADHDKTTDIFYKFGGGARLRQYWYNNSTAGALPNDEDFLNTSHRAQLDLTLNKGEYFETYFRAIHHSTWGEVSQAQHDEFFLQQAWGSWKVTDFLTLKFGRQPLQLGRGLVYGYNEWENIPSYYDGFSTLFDWNVMELSVYALKVYELEKPAATAIASDPEVSHYILDLNFKELSDLIQMADLNFVQIIGDVGQIPGTTTLLKKQRVQRFGLDLVASGVYFEVATSLNYVTGTKKDLVTTDRVKQLMGDFELKFMMPDWEQLNVWVGGHYDTGDNAPNDGTDEQYEPLNYNFHLNAGRLDFFKFGNLTFLRAGSSMHLLSDWYFGVEGFLFQKSKLSAPNYLERSLASNDFMNNVIQFGNNKDLGTEVDIWVGKTFPSGVNMELTLNFLKPGDAMKSAYEVATGNPKLMDRPIYNVIFDLGFFF